jgi:DNA-binding IclR family transcriptional regulator
VKVRQQGYALDQEEYARGIGCVAAPIWDYRNQAIAAIGVTGHIKDYTEEDNLAHVIQQVTDAAQAISRSIGALPEGENHTNGSHL